MLCLAYGRLSAQVPQASPNDIKLVEVTGLSVEDGKILLKAVFQNERKENVMARNVKFELARLLTADEKEAEKAAKDKKYASKAERASALSRIGVSLGTGEGSTHIDDVIRFPGIAQDPNTAGRSESTIEFALPGSAEEKLQNLTDIFNKLLGDAGQKMHFLTIKGTAQFGKYEGDNKDIWQNGDVELDFVVPYQVDWKAVEEKAM